MARSYLDTGVVPPAEDVGLPERVVRAYGKWIAEQDVEQIKQEQADRWHLRRPEILVDPWGEGVFLDLPPQQVPATSIYSTFAWHVGSGSTTVKVPAHPRRAGFDWATETESVRLAQPEAEYEVSFVVDSEIRRTWHYQGFDDTRPLFVFDAERGTALAWPYSLPARTLGLVYPSDCALRMESNATHPVEGDVNKAIAGTSGLREVLPRLPGGWESFRGEIWDLTQASRLRLIRDGTELLSIVVQVDETAQRPELVGGNRLIVSAMDRDAPVYIGAPPSIRIPLTGRGTTADELARWRLAISNKWAAAPDVQIAQTLGDLQAQLVPGEGFVDLPLSLPRLLGASPMGNYTIRLRGPLGRGEEFTLRLVPRLVICGHEELIVPSSAEGHLPTSLLVEVAAGDSIECRGSGMGTEERVACRDRLTDKRATSWEYEVEVGPEVSRVEMTVVRVGSGADAIRVPVRLPIRRLRWAWADETEQHLQRTWTGRVIRRPIEALLQSDGASLMVYLPVEETETIGVTVRLLDVADRELMVREIPRPPRGHYVWRADLSAFLDTIRANTSPVLRLELSVQGLPGAPSHQRWRVASLTRSLIVKDVRVRSAIRGDNIDLSISWSEEAPLQYRRLRLWSLWRPWQPPYEVGIPDGALGRLDLSLPTAKLMPGAYRLQFVVIDPWSPEVPLERPEEGAPSTMDIALTMPRDRLDWLTRKITRTANPFEFLLERAYVRWSLNDAEGSRQDQQQCQARLDEASVPLILALHALVAAGGTPDDLKALALGMFSATRVRHLLHLHREDSLSLHHLQEYLALIPRAELLPLETARVLLTVADERARLFAAQQLVARSDAEGPTKILEWVRDAQLSDADAIAMLKKKATFSLEQLAGYLPEPVALRLYEALARQTGAQTRIVKLGLWVYTDAGWGRLDEIVNQQGEAVEQFIRGDDAYRLHLTLRPDVQAEPLVVDLGSKTLSFSGSGPIYTCAKCHRFSTANHNLLVGPHNHAAHGGIEARLRWETSTTRALCTLEYRNRKPTNELA